MKDVTTSMRGRQQGSERIVGLRSEAPEPHDLDPVLAFMQQLWSIDRGMRAISADMREKLGVTGPERLILRMVGHCPGISAGQLARLLRRHPSSLTSALDRLMRRGMLKGTADKSDRRRLVLTLSSCGRRLNKLDTGTVEAAMRRSLASISAENRKVAARVLAVIESELMSASESSDD